MSFCGKSFHIIIETVFKSSNAGQLWLVSLIALEHLHLVHDDPLAHQYGSFSVIFTLEFNYLFT